MKHEGTSVTKSLVPSSRPVITFPMTSGRGCKKLRQRRQQGVGKVLAKRNKKLKGVRRINVYTREEQKEN